MTKATGLLAVVALLASCGPGGEDASLRVAMDMAALTGPAADPGTPVLDEQGFASLDVYPIFLVLRVSADDLDAPVTASWPDRVPEETPEEVTIDLSVPAGEDRSVEVTLVAAEEDGQAQTWAAPAPGDEPVLVNVGSGDIVDVDLDLSLLERGTVRATLSRTEGVAGVAWVDDALGAVLPAQAPEDGSVVTSLAVGRLYWPRILFDDGRVEDLPDQPVSLSRPDQLIQVTITLDD